MPMRPTPYHQDGKGKSHEDVEVVDVNVGSPACIEIRYVFEGEDMRVRGSGVLRK